MHPCSLRYHGLCRVDAYPGSDAIIGLRACIPCMVSYSENRLSLALAIANKEGIDTARITCPSCHRQSLISNMVKREGRKAVCAACADSIGKDKADLVIDALIAAGA